MRACASITVAEKQSILVISDLSLGLIQDGGNSSIRRFCKGRQTKTMKRHNLRIKAAEDENHVVVTPQTEKYLVEPKLPKRQNQKEYGKKMAPSREVNKQPMKGRQCEMASDNTQSGFAVPGDPCPLAERAGNGGSGSVPETQVELFLAA